MKNTDSKFADTIAAPVNKHVWGMPAAINFILSGTAVGFYILWALAGDFHGLQQPASFGGLMAAAMALAGFSTLSLEAGKPLRARYLATSWRHSWMSREAVAGAVFIVAAATDALTGYTIIRYLAVAAGCLLLCSQAMMLFSCKAVPVWRHAAVPLVIISSGFSAAYGLIVLSRFGLILPSYQYASSADAIAAVCLLINALSWIALLIRKHDAGKIIKQLRTPSRLAIVVGAGQIIPLAVLWFTKPWSYSDGTAGPAILLILAGLAATAGSTMQRYWLIRSVQHVCGMQLSSGYPDQKTYATQKDLN